jgi:UDPglucose 6-dehydrogenase
MAVNTPTKTDGDGAGMAADLRYVEDCAKNIAKVARTDKIVVEKSTLPVRTAEKIKEILSNYNSDVNFEIISNPEFLAEGTAIKDLFKSDRVLIGGDNTKSGQKAIQTLVQIYNKWIPKEKILTTNVWSSELAKLASNAMLAQRISSINSLSALCEKTGADIDELSKAIGMDHRIGPKFLKTSVGFGGSCFQKDILNLVYLCNHFGLDEVAEYWYQVLKINNYQKNRFAQKIIDDLGGDVKGQIITVFGWAFKENTNDSRESAAIHVTNKLLEAGARVKIYDPMVKEDRIRMDLKLLWELSSLNDKEMKKRNDLITIDKDRMAALSHSVAIAILTEWEEFKNYKWDVISKYQKIYDGRKIIQKDISSVDSIYSIGS